MKCHDASFDAGHALTRLQTIFDGASVGIAHIWTRSGTRCTATPGRRRSSGYTGAELRELTFRDVIHPDHLEEQLALHAELVAGSRIAYDLEKRYVRKDGGEVWTFTRTTSVTAEPEERPTAIAVIQDITERKQTELALQRNSDRLTQLVETLRDIAAAGVDLDTVVSLIVERAMALTGSDGAIVSLVEGEELLIAGACGVTAHLLHERRPLEGSIVWHAIDAHDTLLIQDTLSDPRINHKMQARIGDFSLICVPLFAGDDPVAALNVMSCDFDRRLDEQDRRTLELLAVALSAAVSRAAEFEAKREQVGRARPLRGDVHRLARRDAPRRPRGRIVETNAAIQDLLGHDAEALGGREVSDFAHARGPARSWQRVTGRLRGDEPLRVDHRFVRRDGAIVWAISRSRSSATRATTESFTIASSRTSRSAAGRAGAARAGRAQRVPGAPRRAHRPGQPHALRRPDRAGDQQRAARRHAARGRAAWTSTASRRSTTRSATPRRPAAGRGRRSGSRPRCAESDTVARLGGDEFGVLLPGVDDARRRMRVDGADARGDRPSRSCVEGLPLVIEGSIGIALFPEHGDDVETLLQHADVAMYHAKEKTPAGRSTTRRPRRARPGRLTLVGELRRAIERQRAGAALPAQGDLADGAGRGRSRRSCAGSTPSAAWSRPDDFIPLAEQTGLIKPLTRYVLDAALRQCRAWQRATAASSSIAVNLSTRNLLDVEFPDEVARAARAPRRRPPAAELEITETTMMADPPRTRRSSSG